MVIANKLSDQMMGLAKTIKFQAGEALWELVTIQTFLPRNYTGIGIPTSAKFQFFKIFENVTWNCLHFAKAVVIVWKF